MSMRTIGKIGGEAGWELTKDNTPVPTKSGLSRPAARLG
jgi:hypothetical protein